MATYPEIKSFVQNTLGCSCPEEVFENIEYEINLSSSWERRINVGNRLLIYIINICTDTDVVSKVQDALEKGVAERNNNNLNRFRLVLVTPVEGGIRVSAEKAFNESKFYDDKTHIHFVNNNDISGFDHA